MYITVFVSKLAEDTRVPKENFLEASSSRISAPVMVMKLVIRLHTVA